MVELDRRINYLKYMQRKGLASNLDEAELSALSEIKEKSSNPTMHYESYNKIKSMGKSLGIKEVGIKFEEYKNGMKKIGMW